jgi:lipoprotein signal peptidase
MKNLRLLFSLGILSNCIAYDQATKQIARSAALKQSSFLEWLDIALGCRYIKNSRGLVELSGIPEDLRVLFFVAMLMVLFMALVELLLVAKKAPTMVIGGMSLIVGGGVSNLLV